MWLHNKIIKRLVAVLMVVIVSFGVTTASYEKTYAMAGEGVLVAGGTTIAVETALGWLLKVFGFTAASALVYENRDSIMDWCSDRVDEFKEFCTTAGEGISVTANEVDIWLQKLAAGTLDKSSACYSAFRNWCVELATGSNSSVTTKADVSYNLKLGSVTRKKQEISNAELTGGAGIVTTASQYTGFTNYKRFLYNSSTYYYAFTNIPVTGVCTTYQQSASGSWQADYTVCSLDDFIALDTKRTPGYAHTDKSIKGVKPVAVSVGDYTVYVHLIEDMSFKSSTEAGSKCVGEWIQSISKNYVTTYAAYNNHFILAALTFLDHLGLLDGINSYGKPAEVSVADKTQQIIERDKTLDNYDIVSPVTGVDTSADVLDIPWNRVGTYDNAGILDISDVLDLPITDVVDGVAIPVDTVEDKTIADDLPVADVVTDTSSLDDYTMKGLQSVFPFCIPFDFINFIGCLSAEPEAPRFEWKMTFLEGLGFEPYTMVIDLSAFNTVASVMRTMELLAFIIALIMVTRNKFIRG
jgi:hypothetical protein